MQWDWRTKCNLPLNNQTWLYISSLMLPPILADVLLCVSNPYPTPPVECIPARMSHTISQVHDLLLWLCLMLTVFEQLFLARLDWLEMLRESHSCYIKHSGKSSSSTTI